MTWSYGGLGLIACSIAVFLASLGLRRTYATWIFDVLVVVGALATFAARLVHAGEPRWAAWSALGVVLIWFAATRKELGLPRHGARVSVGDRLPDIALETTGGGTRRTGELGTSGP